jgi:hypothetical protein
MYPLICKNKKVRPANKMRLSKCSNTFTKKNMVSPKPKISNKKSNKVKKNDLLEFGNKCYETKSKRTLISTFVKNSTRFSENYSNINTSGGRNKKPTISSSRSLKKGKEEML